MRKQIVFDYLNRTEVVYDYYDHPATPTIELAKCYWRDDGSMHCKNLFLRNHKGDRHYLVVFDCDRSLAIHDLEQRLRQGKLSFASELRMERYLGVSPGSVSPFGLINDTENQVHLFLDRNLQKHSLLSFHPNDNTGTIVIGYDELVKYLNGRGTSYEFITLYE